MTAAAASYGRVVALSPHCDDAVLGCGDLLAAHAPTIVVTVFAATPPPGPAIAGWDADAGFGPGDDVGVARRAEDRAALAHLDAHPVHLPYLDDQYGAAVPGDVLRVALRAALVTLAPDTVVAPLGLFHRDHLRVADAALALARGGEPPCRWLLYADALYRRDAAALAARIDRLRRAGFALAPAAAPTGGASARKRAAIACYRSQLRALATPGRPGIDDGLAPETIWRLRLA